jgi:hypothetical protein
MNSSLQGTLGTFHKKYKATVNTKFFFNLITI